jgi:hypothetical protein
LRAPAPQLQYDIKSCVHGFVETLRDIERRHGRVALLARKLNQDPLESLFGRMRQVRTRPWVALHASPAHQGPSSTIACGQQHDHPLRSVSQALGGKREVSAKDARGLIDRLQKRTKAAAKRKRKKQNKERLKKQNAALDDEGAQRSEHPAHMPRPRLAAMCTS